MSNKFETNELLRGGKLYTPIPKFFFRLWRSGRDLPSSFWCTLMYILDATLGGSMAGVEGYLAQSQIPVDPHESGKWIAAMAGYGRLLEVTYSDGSDQKGSKFKLNPKAAEGEWEAFVFALRVAYAEGVLSRDSRPEKVREIFNRYSELISHPPLWSTMLYSWLADKNMPDDAWDDWVKRGFDMRDYREYVDKSFRPRPAGADEKAAEIACLEELLFMDLCHLAWVNGHNGLVPDDRAELKKTLEVNHNGDISEGLDRALARFQKVEDPEWGPCLQNEWLAQEWASAKKAAQIEARMSKREGMMDTPVLVKVLEEDRRRVPSLAPKQKTD